MYDVFNVVIAAVCSAGLGCFVYSSFRKQRAQAEIGKKNRSQRSLALLLVSASTLMISACGQGGSGGTPEPVITTPIIVAIPAIPDVIPVEDLSVIPTDEVRPYRVEGPYADVLKACAYPDIENPCKLSTLPYIGQDTKAPTVDDILDRTLVTHDWMGLRLGELLQALPADMLHLFQPVTSLVIGSNVRPSTFQPANGRIEIDASYLWLSVEEKKNISRDDDYRTNYGADLQFVSHWRLMRGDENAIPYSSLLDYNERELEDILLLAASPMYHELAHANDFMRPSIIDTLSFDLTPSDAVALHWNERVSARLYSDESFTSLASELYGLARIRFLNDTPEEYQKTLQADFVGSVMSNEGKAQFYGYVTQMEDVATLFEHLMFKLHFDADTHIGFTNKPTSHPEAACEEYIVAWGSRNRIAAPLVLARAKWVTEQFLGPSSELDEFVSYKVGEETPLRMGDNWCESKFSTPTMAGTSRKNQGTVSVDDQFRAEQRIYRNH